MDGHKLIIIKKINDILLPFNRTNLREECITSFTFEMNGLTKEARNMVNFFLNELKKDQDKKILTETQLFELLISCKGVELFDEKTKEPIETDIDFTTLYREKIFYDIEKGLYPFTLHQLSAFIENGVQNE